MKLAFDFTVGAKFKFSDSDVYANKQNGGVFEERHLCVRVCLNQTDNFLCVLRLSPWQPHPPAPRAGVDIRENGE